MTVRTPQENATRWSLIFNRSWGIIGLLILTVVAGAAIGYAQSAFIPVAIGLFIVLILGRAIERLEEKMSRMNAALTCYGILLLALVIAGLFIIPPLVNQVTQFVKELPHYIESAFAAWNTYAAAPQQAGMPTWVHDTVVNLQKQLLASANTWVQDVAGAVLQIGGGIATAAFEFVMGLLIGFWLLVDLPRLGRELFVLAGPKAKDGLEYSFRTIMSVTGGWIRGNLIQSSIMSVLIWAGLSLVGYPYALVLGLIGGFFNIIPYVGPAIALVIVAIVGLFVAPMTAVWGLLIVVAVQQLVVFYLQPRVMSEQMDVHPMIVIVAVLFGGAIAGLWGMLLSIPVAAVVSAVFTYTFEHRTERQLAYPDGVLFRSKGAPPASEAETPSE